MPIFSYQPGTDDRQRKVVRAASQAQGLIWLLKNDCSFADTSVIYMEEVLIAKDLIGDAPPAVITTTEAAALTGLGNKDVRNRVQRGVFVRAGKGLLQRASVQAWLDQGGKAGEPDASERTSKAAMAREQKKRREREVRRKHVQAALPAAERTPLTVPEVVRLTGLDTKAVYNRMNSGTFLRTGKGLVDPASVTLWLEQGRPGKRRKATKAGPAPKPAEPRPRKPEEMVRMEKLAKELGMELQSLEHHKSKGHIEGVFGWVERNAMMAYLETIRSTADA